MTKLAVISGGLREPSSTRLLADRITSAVEAALADRDLTASATVIELRPLARPITDAMLGDSPLLHCNRRSRRSPTPTG
jgi:FMN reductase